jgi:release factor glutamine methyltransferase
LGLDADVRWYQGSLLDPLSGRFDLVCANLPYVALEERESLPPDVRDYEPAVALYGGRDGMEAHRALVPRLQAVLRRPGAAFLEIDPRRLTALRELVRWSAPGAEWSVLPDLAGLPRVLILEFKGG